jgi:hypothetical protein
LANNHEIDHILSYQEIRALRQETEVHYTVDPETIQTLTKHKLRCNSPQVSGHEYHSKTPRHYTETTPATDAVEPDFYFIRTDPGTNSTSQSHYNRLAGDLDGLHLGLLDLLLGYGDGEHAVLHGRLDLLRLGVLGEPESAHELAAAALHAVPGVRLLLLLLVALAADLENVAVLDLHLHLLLLQPRDVRLEHVRLGSLLPVESRPREGRGLGVRGDTREEVAVARAEGEALERVPEVEGEGVEHVAAADQRHGR